MNIPINFYCIGAQKAGTTTLHDILKEHPDIFLPERKEAPFYQDHERYEKGVNWYIDEYFSKYKGQRIVGSVSPEFMYYPWVPERMFSTIGDNIKFIVLLRNPIDRAVSHYNMSVGSYRETRAFHVAIKNELATIAKSHYNNKHFSYISRGHYLKQLKRYFEYFPLENFLFIKFEEIIKNQDKLFLDIQSFLGIENFDLNIGQKSNEAFVYTHNIIPKIEENFKGIFKIIRKLLSPTTRSWVSSFYKKKQINKFGLSKVQKNELYKRYFAYQHDELENIIEMDLSSWCMND